MQAKNPKRLQTITYLLASAAVASGVFLFFFPRSPPKIVVKVPMNRPILEELSDLELGPEYYIRSFIDDAFTKWNRARLRSLHTKAAPALLPDAVVYVNRSLSIDVSVRQAGFIVFESNGSAYTYHVIETKAGKMIAGPVRTKKGQPTRLYIELTKGTYYVVNYKESDAPDPDINYATFWTEMIL